MTQESESYTPNQQRRLAEFDDTERILHEHLKELLERRREYINKNQLKGLYPEERLMIETKWFHHSPSGSQHTAGGFVTDSADRRSTDARTICHVHHSQEYGRLIAAAPEMLEVLKGLMSIVEESISVTEYHLNGATAEWDEFEEVRTARMLISKIRGDV